MKTDIFRESIRLARKFPSKVVTHAVKDDKTFLAILKGGKINLPSQIKGLKKMTPYMEKVLGIEDSIYLGLGFVYNTSHHNWPYAFIFNKNILKNKEITTYAAFLVSHSWLRFLRKVKKEDPNLLLSIRNKNSRTKKEIDMLFKTDRCNWFHIEKELSTLFNHYKNKEEHIQYIKKFQRSKVIKNSYAPRYMTKDYYLNPSFKKFEAISKKPISLNDENFIGVYVHKSKQNMIKNIKNYLGKGKIIYTGSKIIK